MVTHVYVTFRDFVTGQELAACNVRAVPRDGEFVKLDGRVHKVFDVEHELFPQGDTSRVTVRLSSPPK
jgi:hypothetical protein